jgi:isopentenyl diphosphate isomerase/L-lactate dehydrogenase-like FMN-dependent dehydrogenase
LGATAVALGRAYLYGLAAGGERGVARALQIMDSELRRTMALCGRARIAALTRDLVFQRRLP